MTERLKDKAEEFFKCEYELFVEFTGLIRLLLSLLTPPMFGLWHELLVKFYSLSIFTVLSNDAMLYYESAGAEEQALDGIVMITGPTSNSVTLQLVFNFQPLF